ncbi:MAG: hypothetical protein K6G10_08510 [Butyrivibrio sp.]|nr:hypothetical protein [Butyrivibrio sp.]
MHTYIRWIIFTLIVVYIVSPVDFMSGPIDDIALVFLLLATRNRVPIETKKKRDNEYIEVIDVDGKEI